MEARERLVDGGRQQKKKQEGKARGHINKAKHSRSLETLRLDPTKSRYPNLGKHSIPVCSIKPIFT